MITDCEARRKDRPALNSHEKNISSPQSHTHETRTNEDQPGIPQQRTPQAVRHALFVAIGAVQLSISCRASAVEPLARRDNYRCTGTGTDTPRIMYFVLNQTFANMFNIRKMNAAVSCPIL